MCCARARAVGSVDVVSKYNANLTISKKSPWETKWGKE